MPDRAGRAISSSVPAHRRTIPLVDLDWQHRQIADELEIGWKEILSESSYILGPAVEDFERRFAGYVGVKHCVGVGNGTDALELALRSLGVGPGDEVIVPANSFVASAVAVVRAGAKPKFVDVDPDTHLLDLQHVEEAITPSTRAVMPVHLYGQMAPMEELTLLLEGKDVFVVEDAAQAHGSSQDGASMGQLSHVAATSFYPGKNLGAYGDGGAVLTNDSEVAGALRRLRNLGSTEKYRHPEIGFNSRLDSLQAVVLSAKLTRLDEWNRLRAVAADRYRQTLTGLETVGFPKTLPGNQHNWHLFVVRVPDRDHVLQHLEANGIQAGIHYPTPIHLEDAFTEFRPTDPLPVAERLADQILTLPLHPGLAEDDQDYVVAKMLEVVN